MTMRSGDDGPKIVQIETCYVETEAVNFREVVQSLTGKNSSIAAAHHPSSALLVGATTKPQEAQLSSITNVNALTLSPMPLNNVSFKDFDRFFADLPSIEDLLC